MAELKRFRKKPVVIDAMKYDGVEDLERLFYWATSVEPQPDIYGVGDDVFIGTLEGEMSVSPGDYIIRGVQGEFYPCKPDIFEATYEEITDLYYLDDNPPITANEIRARRKRDRQ